MEMMLSKPAPSSYELHATRCAFPQRMQRRATTANTLIAWSGAHESKWKPVPTNVYTKVPFTWIRCWFFVACIMLYCTDIVRSGLGVQTLQQFGKDHVGIGTFYSFGPYAYPLQTIRKVTNASTGTTIYFGTAQDDTRGVDAEVKQVPLWPYKFDTLSVGPRALAIHLGVKEYPTCLLTRAGVCSFDSLSMEMLFALLDGLMTKIEERLNEKQEEIISFATEHQWVDTIEQAIFTLVRDTDYTRYYTIHSYRHKPLHRKSPVELLALCRRWDKAYDRPSFCTTITWSARIFLAEQNASIEAKVEEHMALRFARFQVENPELEFEMLILSAHNFQSTESSGAVFYSRDSEEMMTLIRGRKCDKDQHCETVLIDDYRYERCILDTNVAEMFGTIASIRGAAQGYVWLRVVMLAAGIVSSTWYESRSASSVGIFKVLYMSWVNLLKVPSHVVIYGAWVPVVLYATAHLIDCYLYHVVIQDALTTTLGKNPFVDVRNDTFYVTLKMRNIWVIGLVCTLIVGYKTHYYHQGGWRHRVGIVGFRGSLMSTLSFTTIFFPMRFPSLRHIDILSFQWSDTKWSYDAIWASLRQEFSMAATGPYLEIRCFCLALVALAAVLVFIRLLSMVLRFPMPRIMAHSTIIPYSAGTLWPTTALTGFWDAKMARRVRYNVIAPESLDKTGPKILTRHAPSRVRALCVEKRSEEVWSLIRLMNVAMMTNPWEFVWLRMVGVDLYMYRWVGAANSKPPHWFAKIEGDAKVAFFLPERIEVLYHRNQLQQAHQFELIGMVNSTKLTWNELVMCG